MASGLILPIGHRRQLRMGTLAQLSKGTNNPLRQIPNFTSNHRVNTHLSYCLNSVLNVKAESGISCFQQGEGPFGWTFVSSSSTVTFNCMMMMSLRRHMSAHCCLTGSCGRGQISLWDPGHQPGRICIIGDCFTTLNYF